MPNANLLPPYISSQLISPRWVAYNAQRSERWKALRLSKQKPVPKCLSRASCLACCLTGCLSVNRQGKRNAAKQEECRCLSASLSSRPPNGSVYFVDCRREREEERKRKRETEGKVKPKDGYTREVYRDKSFLSKPNQIEGKIKVRKRLLKYYFFDRSLFIKTTFIFVWID